MISGEMSILDIVNTYPQVIQVFRAYGLGCIGCLAARYESLAQGAEVHGIDLEDLLNDLNAAIEQA